MQRFNVKEVDSRGLVPTFLTVASFILCGSAAIALWDAESLLWLLAGDGSVLSFKRPVWGMLLVLTPFILLNIVGESSFLLSALLCLTACQFAVRGKNCFAFAAVIAVGYVPLGIVLYSDKPLVSEPFASSPLCAACCAMSSAGIFWGIGAGFYSLVEYGRKTFEEHDARARMYLHDNVGNPLSVAALGIHMATRDFGSSDKLELVEREVQRAARALAYFSSSGAVGRGSSLFEALSECEERIHGCGLRQKFKSIVVSRWQNTTNLCWPMPC